MAVSNQGKESKAKGRVERHPGGGRDPSIQSDSKLRDIKRFGSIDIAKPMTFLAKILTVFVLVNILGAVSTNWSSVLSPKYRSIDKAVASLDLPKDWVEVARTGDERMPDARDYLGSCRWVQLFDSGPCVTNTHYYKATFDRDPRDVIKEVLDNSSALKYYNQSDACGIDEAKGFGECSVLAVSGVGYQCSIDLPFAKNGATSGLVTIRCRG